MEPSSPDPAHYYLDLCTAYVRGSLGARPAESAVCLLQRGRAAGLRLNRFKKTQGLPRVHKVLGMLRGLAPASLLDIGSGRGAFLWPLLDAFPALGVTSVELDPKRLVHLRAVRAGGIERLLPVRADVRSLPFGAGTFPVVTVLEVLEHLADPLVAAREVCRVARGFIIASVPSKEDDNPHHVRRFTRADLEHLLLDAGAIRVRTTSVLNHLVALARVEPP